MRREPIRVALACIAAAILTMSGVSAQTALFSFHSAFWINLHFYLHALCRNSEPITEPLPTTATTREQDEWAKAIAIYRERHGSHSLLGDQGLIILTGHVAEAESKPSLAETEISVSAREVLHNAAPVYRRYRWPTHDADNHAFIARLQPLLDRHGADIAARVAASYGTTWPEQPIRVDVVPDAGRPGNAHSTIYPTHVKIAATDPRHKGFAALEMMFHEASHAWGSLLIKDVDDAAARLGRPAPANLWHALLFFNAGFITADVLRAAGIEKYEMYGDAQGVFDRLLKGARGPMGEHWPIYLEGRVSRQEAVFRILRDLP